MQIQEIFKDTMVRNKSHGNLVLPEKLPTILTFL